MTPGEWGTFVIGPSEHMTLRRLDHQRPGQDDCVTAMPADVCSCGQFRIEVATPTTGGRP